MQASARPDTMPAFRPLKTRATVLLLGGAEWGKVALAAALGALLAFSLGAIKHVEEVPMGNSERMAKVAELEQVRATVKSLDSRMKAAGAASLSAIDVTVSERQDAQRAAALRVNAREAADYVAGAVDVLNPVRGLIRVARHALAVALIRRVEGKGDVAGLGQLLRVQARDLLLDAAVRVRNDYSGVFFVVGLVIPGGDVDVRHELEAVEHIAYGYDVDLARHVFSYGSRVDQAEGVIIVCALRGDFLRRAIGE